MSHMDDLNALMSRVNKSGDKDSIKFVRKLIAAVKEGDKGAVRGIVHFNRDQANLVPASVTKWLKEEAMGENIQENEWGGGFQTYKDAHREVQAGLRADMVKQRNKTLALMVQVIRGEISKQKFKKLTGSSFDDLMKNAKWYINQIKKMPKSKLAPVAPASAAPTATESVDMDIQEAEKAVAPNDDELRRLLDAANEIRWGRSGHHYHQRDVEVKKLLNKAKKFAMVTRDEGLQLSWIDLNYFYKHIKVRKPKPNLNRSFGGVHDPSSYGRGGVADSYEAEGDDIQEKVEIDGRTRMYRETVMRLEQARKIREGRAKAMQENRFGGLYDDGSGKGAMIPAPVDFNFHEAMKVVEKYRSLREKKKTLLGGTMGETAGNTQLASFLKKYKRNEDINNHSENVVLLAKFVGSSDEIAQANRILRDHDALGYLSPELSKEQYALYMALKAKLLAKYPNVRGNFTVEGYDPNSKEENLNAAVAMKDGKFSMQETKLSPKQKEYRQFFAKALKKFGHESPADMDDGEKKKFFNWVEKNWKG